MSSLTPEVETVFRTYNWAGNVRELRNVIERTLILEDDDTITTEYLPGGLMGQPLGSAGTVSSEKLSKQFVLPIEGICLDEAELAFVRCFMYSTMPFACSAVTPFSA